MTGSAGTTGADFGATSKALLHETILSGLDDLLSEHAWNDVSLAQVAAKAGVSRQTLYNTIGGRPEITQAYVVWSAGRLLDEVDRVVADHPGNLREACRAAFEVFLEIAPDHPLLQALVAATGADDLRAMVTSPAGAPLFEAATQRLGDIVLHHWPEVAGPDFDAVIDVLVRMAISHVTVPTGAPAHAADALVRALGPTIDAIVGAAQPAP
jgi:AcrR family transcriptional regulator